jgi:hypothetical protein
LFSTKGHIKKDRLKPKKHFLIGFAFYKQSIG